jgi:hypothetical protein
MFQRRKCSLKVHCSEQIYIYVILINNLKCEAPEVGKHSVPYCQDFVKNYSPIATPAAAY